MQFTKLSTCGFFIAIENLFCKSPKLCLAQLFLKQNPSKPINEKAKFNRSFSNFVSYDKKLAMIIFPSTSIIVLISIFF